MHLHEEEGQMKKGRITYYIVDATDPRDEFECEGEVVRTFFSTSPVFDIDNSPTLIQSESNIENRLKRDTRRFFNVFHLAAHGAYFKRTKKMLDYSCIYGKRGKQEREIFRPDTLVRVKLQADLFLSTCCNTFNDYFLEEINGYGEVYNLVAPRDDPLTGDTIIFSLMFYNELIRRIRVSQKQIPNDEIKKAFQVTNKAYKAYKGLGRFALYNCQDDRVYE
jgi:hypothetical protein